MGFFDLPPESKRLYENSWLLWGNCEGRRHLNEPDYYIKYRLGRDIRYLSIISGFVAYFIAILHRHYGYYPSLNAIVPHENFLEFYLYLINFSGPIILPVLIYYYLLFAKNIDFSEYNLMRNNPKGNYSYRDIHPTQLKTLIIFLVLFIPFSIWVVWQPSICSGPFYYFDQLMSDYFDSSLFVLKVAIFIAFVQSIIAQMGLSGLYLLLYFNYERKH